MLGVGRTLLSAAFDLDFRSQVIGDGGLTATHKIPSYPESERDDIIVCMDIGRASHVLASQPCVTAALSSLPAPA